MIRTLLTRRVVVGGVQHYMCATDVPGGLFGRALFVDTWRRLPDGSIDQTSCRQVKVVPPGFDPAVGDSLMVAYDELDKWEASLRALSPAGDT